MRDSVFADNVRGDDTIRFAKAQNLLVSGVKVMNASGDAIDCDISRGLIAQTEIISPVNDGIDLMTADVELRDIRVRGAGDKGLSFGGAASPTVSRVLISDSEIGIAIKDGSAPRLRDVKMSHSRTAVAGFDKNWRYEGGSDGATGQLRTGGQ